MPTLFILAGPNGAGKTTFYNNAAIDGIIGTDVPFINVDVIARNLPGSYTEENFAKAALIARDRIAGHIERKEDFMIESNLAKSADYDWIINMQKAGYEVVLYFLCTLDTEINIDRVQRRVAEGGHYIPPHIVIDRYNLSLVYLKSKLHLFKKSYLIDNTNLSIAVMAILEYGAIVSEAEEVPGWVNSVLSIVRRIKR